MRYHGAMDAHLNRGPHEAVIILENIRSAQNVGAIFRTADAICAAKIYLVGYTPTPVDRFGRLRKEVIKTALGAEVTVPWEGVAETASLIARLKSEGFFVVAVENVAGAIDYKTLDVPARIAFIFGNEVDGVLVSTLAAVDMVIAIPMRGKKESLNVATTAGIILFRALDA